MKLDMIDSKYQEILTSPYPTRENTAFTRYADFVDSTLDEQLIFQVPGGQPLDRSIKSATHLFKMQKDDDHWKNV